MSCGGLGVEPGTEAHLGVLCQETPGQPVRAGSWSRALAILDDLDHAETADVRGKLSDLSR
ncbi:hypothetical protein [Actinoplanes sp. CA-252034]|uniref:hypothetical protein n=1 Tax=Actinoplanes sp. CA-252034 TaxID=3239906 RepID=UPI003D96CB00